MAGSEFPPITDERCPSERVATLPYFVLYPQLLFDHPTRSRLNSSGL